MNDLYSRGGGYVGIMITRPQSIGYSLTDSPAGLAAFSTTSSTTGPTVAATPKESSRPLNLAVGVR